MLDLPEHHSNQLAQEVHEVHTVRGPHGGLHFFVKQNKRQKRQLSGYYSLQN